MGIEWNEGAVLIQIKFFEKNKVGCIIFLLSVPSKHMLNYKLSMIVLILYWLNTREDGHSSCWANKRKERNSDGQKNIHSQTIMSGI